MTSLLNRLRNVPWNPGVNNDPLFSSERFKYRKKFLTDFVQKNDERLETSFVFCSHYRSRPFRVRNAVRSPWWNDSVTELHNNIWTPSNDNLVDDGIASLGNTWCASKVVHRARAREDKQLTPLTNKYLSNAKYKLGNKDITRTIKCQIMPSRPQKDVLERAIRAYNTTRSSCVRWIKKRKELAHRLAVRKDKINPLFDLLRSLFVINKRRGQDNLNRYFTPEKKWMLNVPKEIRVSAVKDVVANLKSCLSNVEHGHQRRFVMKLKLKASHCSFGIEKRLTCDKSRKRIELEFEKFFKSNGDCSRVFDCVNGHLFKDGVPDGECKVHRDSSGRYFVLLTYKIAKRGEEYDVRPVIAGDMGIRKFITTYTTAGESHTLGERCGVRIKALLDLRAKLQSLIARKRMTMTSYETFRLERSYRRAGRKIVNLRDELHRKLINWLTTNFSVIILPKLRTRQLISKETGVLGRQTKSVLAALAVTKFYERLTAKCEIRHCLLIDGDECYTTKGCDHCGLINDVRSSERFRCRGCERIADRDVHSARNIFLKNTKLYRAS